jgi:hypothetical protein
MRTYVHTPDASLSMEGWFEGLRAGRAWVSSGPLMEVTVGGEGPGGTLELDEPGAVPVQGRIWSIVPLTRAELVFDGEVVRTWEARGDRLEITIDDVLDLPSSGWVHVRVEGDREERWPLDTSYAQAFTNPVWIRVGGEPIRSAAAADYAIRWIDKLQSMAEAWPGWRAQRERDHVFAQFEEARQIYRRRRAEDGGS